LWHVYILHCSDDSLYVGLTHDLEGRERSHNEGHGARHTLSRRPVRVVYSEPFDTLEAAARRERQIKGWSRVKKDALISGNTDRLKMLSRSKASRRGDMGRS
jgi:putative endonuclease